MWKVGRTAGLVVSVVLLFNGIATAQEGAMHKFFRGVMAIPRALVGSFDGPSGCGEGCFYGQAAGVPLYTVVTTQPYCGVAPTAVIQKDPEYVTYNAVVNVNNAVQAVPPNSYVYDPVPFDAP